jgi:hypothetical protein
MLCRFCLLKLISLNIPLISTRTATTSLVACCSPTQLSLQLTLEVIPFQWLSQNGSRIASGSDMEFFPAYSHFRFSAQENIRVYILYNDDLLRFVLVNCVFCSIFQ